MNDYLLPIERRTLQWLTDTPGGITIGGPVPSPTTPEEQRAVLLKYLTLIGLAERDDISGAGMYGRTYIYRATAQGRLCINEFMRGEIAQWRGRA